MWTLIIAAAALTTGVLVAGPVFGEPVICTSHSASPAYFSPNGDRVQDVTAISFTLAKNAHVKLAVTNSSGTQVRLLLNADRVASSKPYRVVFNGCNQSGKALLDGAYRYVLTCTNGDGTQPCSRAIVIDRVRPSLRRAAVNPSVFWPNGDGYRDSVRVKYPLSERAISGMYATTSGRRMLKRYAGVWQEPGSRYRAWDGKDSRGRAQGYGLYRLVLLMRDRAGNRSSKTLSVLVAPFTDIRSQSATFRIPILSLVGHRVLAPHGSGWFTGWANGTFGPKSRLRRGDLAVALVKTFGWGREATPDIDFSDVGHSSAVYKYAAIVVHHNAMGYSNSKTKAFSPFSRVTAAQAMVAIVRAMGLSRLAANIRAQDPNVPAYAPYMVIAGDLGLRWRYTGIFPNSSFNRRETALSLNEKIHLESWQVHKMRVMFGSVAARRIRQSRRQRAITNAARRLIGYPYVWGGDSFSEGGFDCSGFTWQVFRNTLGYHIQRTSYDAAADSRYPRVSSRSALKPGDTIYFKTISTGRIGHTGIYLGNGYFIHSTRSRGGISIDRFDREHNSYWVEQFAWGRRIIPVVRLTGVALSSARVYRNKAPASTAVYFRISKRCVVTVRVLRGSRVVRTVVQRWMATGRRGARWNGRDSSGKLVPLGRYSIRLTVRDEEYNSRSAARSVTVAK